MDTVHSMIKARDSLKPDIYKNPGYQKIYHSIVDYIHRNCIHEIVDDYVDVDTETSIPIKYCGVCFTVFS